MYAQLENNARLLMLTASLALCSVPAARAREPNLNRSFYVPIRFTATPELAYAQLQIVGEETWFSPGPRVFLFTYTTPNKRRCFRFPSKFMSMPTRPAMGRTSTETCSSA